jgi:RND family efflux transporter MFP subunit
VTCVIVLVVSSARARADDPPLTIEAAVHSALAHNERSLKAPLRVKAAEGQVIRARAGFLPTLGAGATGTLNSTEDRAGRIVAGSGAITLTLPLLNLPAIPTLYQARRQLESERWGAVEDRRVLAFETARAFLVVLTTERVPRRRRAATNARANQQNAEVRAQAQLASTNDVTRARLETAAAGREVAQAKGNVARARLELGFLMGVPADEPLVAPDRTTHAAETTTAGTEDMIREAEARRPDVRSAKARTLALRYAAQEPLYRLAPSLTLGGQVRAFTNAGPTEPFHDEMLQLGLTWTLFDAGVRYGDRKTRVAQADSQALDERLLRRSIAVDVGVARSGAGDVPHRRRSGGGRHAQYHRNRGLVQAGARACDRARRRECASVRCGGEPRDGEAGDGAGLPRAAVRARLRPRRRRGAVMRARIARLLLAVVVATIGCGDRSQTGGKAEGGGKRRGGGGRGGLAFAVDVLPVKAGKLDYLVTAPGTIEAFERVQVTARVAGVVDRVGFTEGQKVKKGDVLVTIDAERYRLAVNSAKAALDKADAAVRDVQSMVNRREAVSGQNPGLIPGEELETYRARSLSAKADREVAAQALKTAELNLRDSSVRAPIAGVIQTRTVETGQYVQPRYTMATLLRSDPLLLRFSVEPLEAPRIKPGMIANFTMRETLRKFQARITLVAAAADPATHMVGVTAEVLEKGHRYWLRPGSFCDVTVDVSAQRAAVLIPRMAARATDHGYVAYVVDGAVARERVLSLGMSTRDGWVEVRSGLKDGDRVVVRGAEALADGAKVRATEVSTPPEEALGPATPAALATVDGGAER